MQFFHLLKQMTTETNATATNIIREPICDGYEWIQYNNQLRVIHSFNDDMYQMKSIIKACNSNKPAKDWFKNDNTIELLNEFKQKIQGGEFPPLTKTHENRANLPIGIRGYYVHRILVNAVAMWASPRYAVDIFVMLDKIATEERKQMEEAIEKKGETITNMKPRQVPANKEKRYKYMIWKEEIDGEPDMILLHLVRRNNTVFREVNNIRKSDKCWFFRENLPIAMTPNEDVKQIVKNLLPGSEYDIKCSSIKTYKKALDKLHAAIESYFDTFQN